MHVQDRDNRSRKSVSFTSLQLESVNQVKEVEGTGKEVGMVNISSLNSPVLQLRYLIGIRLILSPLQYIIMSLKFEGLLFLCSCWI